MKRNIPKVFLLTGLLLMMVMPLLAQTTVTGKVTDSDGQEVIGATVTVKGKTTIGTVTGIDGSYTLQVQNPHKDVLVFSYIGMTSQEIAVKGRTTIDVKMTSATVNMDEVVVIGYGTTRRKDLTGSVSSIKSDELVKVPFSDITQALEGRIAGVQVQASDGEPGSGISIRVRGGMSITQDNSPLYIIDGFPAEDGLSSLDPATIETIDVLKDASATAIYGSRGANGVIVVTTKNGHKNSSKVTVTLDAYGGFRKLARKLDVMSPYEFVLADYERTIGLATSENELISWQRRYGGFVDMYDNYAHRDGIDWQEEALGRTTTVQNYRIGLSGGTKETQYGLSYNYYKDEGAMVYSGTDRHNFTMNIKSQLSKKLSVNARVSYDQRKIWGSGTAGNGTNSGSSNTDSRFNRMTHIIQYRPIMGIRGSDANLLADEDPLLVDDSGNVMQNPIISAQEEQNDKEYRNLMLSGGLTYKLSKQWTFRNTTGFRYQANRYALFYGDRSIMAKRTSINGSIRQQDSGSIQTSNVLTYEKKMKVHRLTVMLGQEYVGRWARWTEAAANQFPNDEIGLADMSLGTPSYIRSNENDDDKLLSFFTRVNYNYDDRYLLSASLRADGSSKFGKNNKWGYFPAISAAWRLAEEPFIKALDVFSDLKVRIGYGLAGNNRIGSYNSLALMGSVATAVGDGIVSGYASSQVPNPDLKWEANKTFNFGFDFGFFRQRLQITPEFYVNRSSNLLLNAKLPTSSGFNTMMVNAGATRNIGIDLTINTVNISKKDFNWKTTLTLSQNKGKVEELTGESVQLHEARFGFNQSTHKIAVGEPLGQFYGYVTDGLYQVSDFDYNPTTKTYTLKDGIPYHGDRTAIKPGMWKFKNLNGDGVIDENDKTVIGQASPDLYGGINNTLTWKDWDLSVYFTYSIGNEVLNATKLVNTKIGSTNANGLDVVNSHNRWMTIDTKGNIVTDPVQLAAMNEGKTLPAYYDLEQGDYYIHSWAVENASFLRLSNVTLGYTVPRNILKHIGLTKLRFYVTGNNLFTWTKYTGYDPEVSTMSSPLTPGVDFGAYPRSRTCIFGVNIAF